jgi:hypothetical protein
VVYQRWQPAAATTPYRRSEAEEDRKPRLHSKLSQCHYVGVPRDVLRTQWGVGDRRVWLFSIGQWNSNFLSAC